MLAWLFCRADHDLVDALAARTTLHPSLASRRAGASSMPLEVPVTTAILPVRTLP